MNKYITFILCILLSGASLAFFAVKEKTLYTKDTPCEDPDVAYMLAHLPDGSSVTVKRYENDFTVHIIANPIITRNGVSWYWVNRLYPPNPKDESPTVETHHFESCRIESSCICEKFVPGVSSLHMCKATNPPLSHYDKRFIRVENMSPGIFTLVVDLWDEARRNGLSDLLRLAEDVKMRPDFKEDILSNINHLRIAEIELEPSRSAYYFTMEIVGNKRWSVSFDVIDGKLTFIGISSGPIHSDGED